VVTKQNGYQPSAGHVAAKKTEQNGGHESADHVANGNDGQSTTDHASEEGERDKEQKPPDQMVEETEQNGGREPRAENTPDLPVEERQQIIREGEVERRDCGAPCKFCLFLVSGHNKIILAFPDKATLMVCSILGHISR
jgi:hypothetical protein